MLWYSACHFGQIQNPCDMPVHCLPLERGSFTYSPNVLECSRQFVVVHLHSQIHQNANVTIITNSAPAQAEKEGRLALPPRGSSSSVFTVTPSTVIPSTEESPM